MQQKIFNNIHVCAYSFICKYAKICRNICRNICIDPTTPGHGYRSYKKNRQKYARNMQTYAKYVGMKFICKIFSNMQKSALPPLLVRASCWWPSVSGAGRVTAAGRERPTEFTF